MWKILKLLIISSLISSSAYARPIRHAIKLSTASFTPKQLSGLLFWFDAADASTISLATGVSQWSDKSGSGFHATQGTGARQPQYSNTLNGRKVLTFSNASQYYMLFSGSMRVNTLAVVWKATYSTFPRFDGILTARTSLATLTSNGAWNGGLQGVQFGTNICGLGQTTTGAYVDGISVTPANFDSYLTGVNSSPLTSTHTLIHTDDVLSDGAMYFGIGVDVYDIARCFDGDIAEIVAWNRALSVGEINQVQKYLKLKWGTV